MILKALWLWQNTTHKSERATDAARGRVNCVECLSTGEEVRESRRGGGREG